MNTPSAQLRYLSRLLRWLPPETRGKARLARGLLGRSLDEQDVLLELEGGCRFIVPSLREPVGFYLAVDGVYESRVLNFIYQHLPPEGVFVDVGANIGCITVPVALHSKGAGRVLALEAAPSIFPYLEHNLALNSLQNVRSVQCAVAQVNRAEMPFYQAPADHFGMGSLAPQFDTKPVFVTTRTLDSLLAEHSIAHVDVIKVDVEGFECNVFKGVERLLRSESPPIVIFEFCDWAEMRAECFKPGDAQRLLRQFGYHIFRLSDYAKGNPPLSKELTEGFEMLVATRTISPINIDNLL